MQLMNALLNNWNVSVLKHSLLKIFQYIFANLFVKWKSLKFVDGINVITFRKN